MQEKSVNTYFTISLIGVLAGILIGNTLGDAILSILILGVFFIVGCVSSLYYRQLLYSVIFIVLGSSIGIASSILSQERLQDNSLIVDSYEGLYNSHVGEVKSLYKRSEYYDEYILSLHQIYDKNIDRNILHLLKLPKNFTPYPGQVISYDGKMYPLEDFDEFSYKRFMLSKKIYFSTSSSSIEIISEHEYGWRYNFYQSRQKLLSRIEKIFPQQEAIFLGGILFGARENIPAELKEDFNNSGLTHFIAVSGFNITLCVIFISFIFGFLPLIPRAFMVCVSIVLFSIFVGLGAPVVRAAIMGILGYIFLQSGNGARAITLLVFTAVSMTFLNPLALSYDVSLHLSFLAVIGIMYTQEFFTKIFSWLPNVFAIREALVLTLAALSFSLPIMIFQFGQVSLLAPFANIAVTWTIPLAMLLGALTLLIDFIFPFLGEIFGFITWVFLKYDMLMVGFFGNIEWALWKVDFGAYSTYLQCLYFIVLTYFLTLYHLRKKISEKQS